MTRRHVLFALQAVVTLALLVVLFRNFDWSAFTTTLKRVSPLFYLGSFAAIVAGQMLYACRWMVVLQGMGLPVRYSEVLSQYLLGVFFSNLMPTAVGGDAAKVYYLGQRVGYVEVGASVLVDRFLGFLWLSVLGATLAWSVGAPTEILVLNRNILTSLAVILVLLLAIVWVTPVGRLVPRGIRNQRLAALISRIEDLAGFVRAGGCRPWTLAVSGVVVVAYVTMLAIVYLRFFAASGVIVPELLAVMNVLVSMSVFLNVPLSVNGVGLREQLHYLLFAGLGLPKEVSVSLSLLVFSYTLLLSVAGYVVWLRLQPRLASPRA